MVLPRWCLGCGKEGPYICPACARKLPRIIPPVCPLCGLPRISQSLCPSCLRHRWAIDGIRSPFRFEGLVRQAVYQFKYNNLRDIASSLAGLMAIYLDKNQVPGEVLVPVPLHRKRLKQRGYNQSRLLAGELGKITGMPILTDCIRRQRPTPSQADTTSITQRIDNVRDAFIASTINSKMASIILIDDVATSGATLNACAVALKQAGARSVWGLTIAREVWIGRAYLWN